jgi:cell wall-associated NlpC family hydrolase
MPQAASLAPRSVAVTVGLVIAFLLASTASAETALEQRRADAREVLAQIRALDEQVGLAAERWNGANLRLRALEAELASTRRSLARARVGYANAQHRAADRLVELYVAGAPDPALEIMLGARSLGDVIDVLETRNRVADQDANLIRELRRYRNEARVKQRRLQSARAAQRSVVQRLSAARAAVETQLARRERLLVSVQSEVRRLEAEKRAREAALQRRALADVRSQGSGGATQRDEPDPAVAGSSAQDEPPPPPPTGSRSSQVVAIAMRYLGVPYRWGGASPSTGFDCSGFTMYVFAQIGVSLPHYAAAQFRMGVPVSKSQLEPGDLVFFRGLGHMGMYIGGGNFIHAPSTGDVVKISSLSEPYRVASWVGARRVL